MYGSCVVKARGVLITPRFVEDGEKEAKTSYGKTKTIVKWEDFDL